MTELIRHMSSHTQGHAWGSGVPESTPAAGCLAETVLRAALGYSTRYLVHHIEQVRKHKDAKEATKEADGLPEST